MDKETAQGEGSHANSKSFQLLCMLNSIYFTFVFERHFCWIRNYRLTGFFVVVVVVDKCVIFSIQTGFSGQHLENRCLPYL